MCLKGKISKSEDDEVKEIRPTKKSRNVLSQRKAKNVPSKAKNGPSKAKNGSGKAKNGPSKAKNGSSKAKNGSSKAKNGSRRDNHKIPSKKHNQKGICTAYFLQQVF